MYNPFICLSVRPLPSLIHVRSPPLFLLFPVFPQFGDSQQLRLVRILRSTVMVRVGGGWMALDEFLVKNDPCRGKSHTTAGGNLLFRYMEKRFPETLSQDSSHSIILVTLISLIHNLHHLSLLYSFSSMSFSSFQYNLSSLSSHLPSLPHYFLTSFPRWLFLYAWPTHLAHSFSLSSSYFYLIQL